MSFRRWRHLATVLAASVVAALSLAACVASGPRSSEIQDRVRAAVESVDGVEDALVGLSSTGVDALSLRLELYIAEEDAIVSILDSALEAAWAAAPRAPDHISVSVLAAPMPEGAGIGSLDGIDLLPVGEALGFEGLRSSLGVLVVPDGALAARYGKWVKP